MRKIRVLAALFALCGCANQQQIADRQAAILTQQSAADDTKCRSYGAKPGTQPYFDCRMGLDRDHASIEAANQAGAEAARQAAYSNMTVTGARMMRGY